MQQPASSSKGKKQNNPVKAAATVAPAPKPIQRQQSRPVKPPVDPVADAEKKRKRNRLFFLISLALFVLIGLLLFDTKLALMADDADYIMDAYYFVHNNIYPAARSSLYGMTFGIPVAIFGINVPLLKLFSFISATAAFCLFYYSYKDKVPQWLLFCVLVFTAVCSDIQFYSSSNLTEAFYMMVQAAYMYMIFRLLDIQDENKPGQTKFWLLVGLFGLLLSLSKNVAIVAPLALPLFYLCYGRFQNAGKAIGVFLIFKIPYELLLRVIYKKNTLASQMGEVFRHDLYHPEHGREATGGFLVRFFKNANIYLSDDFLSILGLSNAHMPGGPFNTWENNAWRKALTETLKDGFTIYWIIIVALCLAGFILSYKRSRTMFFTGIFMVILIATNFVALEPAFGQVRYIVVFIPLLLLYCLYSLFMILQSVQKKSSMVNMAIVAGFAVIMIAINFNTTAGKISENLPTLMDNLTDDPFYGYTQDWSNYLQMGQYIKKTLPDSVNVAARKPNSLTVYSSGRPFIGIYSVADTASAETLLNQLKAQKIHYLVLASLRANPEMATSQIITTLHQFAKRILDKYPNQVKVIYTIGKTEPCYLVKVDY